MINMFKLCGTDNHILQASSDPPVDLRINPESSCTRALTVLAEGRHLLGIACIMLMRTSYLAGKT